MGEPIPALSRATTWRPALAGAGWVVAGCLVAAAAILLPELVGLLLLHLGPAFDPLGRASRIGCVTPPPGWPSRPSTR